MTHAPAHDRVAVGVDIGGTNIRAARVRQDGRASERIKVPTASAPSVPELVSDLCVQLLDDDVEAIGIGIPGRLDRDAMTILSAGFVDLAGSRLGEVIEKAVGRPVVMENDAHMALLAELAVGAGASASHVVLFTVGTGIGGAVAMERTVLRGRGNAGQLGHLTLDRSGPACNCGRHGCSEVFTSGTALRRLIREAGLPESTTVETLLEQGADDPAAEAVLRRWAGAWRDAIDTVVAVLDPDLVILGGGLGAAAAAAVDAHAPSGSAWFDCPVAPAQLADDAGVIGAGLRAFAR